jgi:anaerobic magnesium-protoporphyrin IX monomethyl ester cyclase
VSVAYPLPGTPFYEQVRKQLGAKTHWDDSGDLALMFNGTFNTQFYRQVRDLLHEQVDLAGPHREVSADSHRQARLSLQQRWDSLIASASHYRSGQDAPVLMK